VGPVWHGGDAGEPELLASCYRNSLVLADEQSLASIAFPAISTGLYGYPPDAAAEIAVTTVRDTLPQMKSVEHVIFVCFDAATAKIYERILDTED
jgi:O-acetyl-ADP-ribose deacetylase (regulator of RNase III)